MSVQNLKRLLENMDQVGDLTFKLPTSATALVMAPGGTTYLTYDTTNTRVLVSKKLACTHTTGFTCEGLAAPATYPTSSTAETRFCNLYFSGDATSGTHRGIYCRLFLTGGAGGEAIRSVCDVSSNTPADTCNGAHISLLFGTSAGNITGLGTAARCTLHIPNRSLTGTTAPVQSEIYSDGASSAVGGVLSFLRLVNDGNSTGKAAVDSGAYLIETSGLTTGTAKLLNASQSFKCRVEGTTYYLPILPAVTDGIVFGVGSDSAYYNFGSTADKNAVEFRFTTAAATGTSRGIYNRLKVTGGAGGESLRTFTNVESNTPADTVNGAHVSLSFGSSAGNVTGLGTAGRFTLHVPNRSLGGTTAAVQAELWADGSSSAIGGTCSLIRGIVDGDGTGKAAVDTNAFLLDLTATDGSGEMIYRAQSEPTWTSKTCLVKCKINGYTTYLVGVEL